jgi:hypothetical protein
MRQLREAEPSLVTTGGRGITAPRMTSVDAASLLTTVYGSESVQDSVPTLLALKSLPASSQGIRIKSSAPYDQPWGNRGPPFTLGLEPAHTIIDGLAAALRLFDREEELRRHFAPPTRRDEENGIYARFTVQYPEYFASLTVGVHRSFSEVWVYGRKKKLKSRQIRECDQDALREIAARLRAP